MRRGGWHQMAWKSQKMISEALAKGTGVGAIFSPRYLGFEPSQIYSDEYRAMGASVLLDPEFYNPGTRIGKIDTFPCAALRTSVPGMLQVTEIELEKLSKAIELENKAIGASAIIAPAVPYEADRRELTELNERLFSAAKSAGDALGLPTYATVAIGKTVGTPELISKVLSGPTSLDADGWYFQFEMDDQRIPNDPGEVFNFCLCGLTLACTDKPVLNASVGPLSLLSFGYGATAVAVSFQQNLWGFDRAKWEASPPSGGNAASPARFFSTSLWGTIVQPDEIVLLPRELQTQILTHSEYSAAVEASPSLPWKKWDANKHLVELLLDTAGSLSSLKAEGAASTAAGMLTRAIELHKKIENAGFRLKDQTNTYQQPWLQSLKRILIEHSDDYLWLKSLGR